MMKENYEFEVCANSVESCIEAQRGGANRVELCMGIPEGGTTPSYGEIKMARDVLKETRLHVIIAEVISYTLKQSWNAWHWI